MLKTFVFHNKTTKFLRWDVLQDAVNMSCSHWLISKSALAYEKTEYSQIQTGKGRGREECEPAAQEERS